MIIRRIRYCLRRAEREAALRLEMDQHLDEAAAELQAGGKSPAAARGEAKRRFGRALAAQEQAREVWIARFMSDASRDARYALRSISRNPGFAGVTMLSAALGIAACTTVFGIVNFALLRPLPAEDPQSLMAISGVYQSLGTAGEVLSSANYGRSEATRAVWSGWPPSPRFCPRVSPPTARQGASGGNWFRRTTSM